MSEPEAVSDELFVSLIRAWVDHKGMRYVAESLDVSGPCVVRWCKGENLPAQAMREPISNEARRRHQ